MIWLKNKTTLYISILILLLMSVSLYSPSILSWLNCHIAIVINHILAYHSIVTELGTRSQVWCSRYLLLTVGMLSMSFWMIHCWVQRILLSPGWPCEPELLVFLLLLIMMIRNFFVVKDFFHQKYLISDYLGSVIYIRSG